MKEIVIGSRASRLALRQSTWVRDRLIAVGRQARIEVIQTSGDRDLDRSLASLGGKGVFVKEIEEALLGGAIDLAVHSLKDLPTSQPGGLTIACVPQREDVRDLLVAAGGPALADLRANAVVGTGSPRRACQLRAARPDLRISDLRGNLDTRLGKLARGDYDAIIVALAGVRRLGVEVDATILEIDQMMPAVGQGALALETRSKDREMADLLRPLHHPGTAAAVAAERAFLRGLGGGCQAPIAAWAELRGDRLVLQGLVGSAEGGRLLRGGGEGPAGDPESVGLSLARELLARGAAELVARAPMAALPEEP